LFLFDFFAFHFLHLAATAAPYAALHGTFKIGMQAQKERSARKVVDAVW